jgi:hypothetical protein
MPEYKVKLEKNLNLGAAGKERSKFSVKLKYFSSASYYHSIMTNSSCLSPQAETLQKFWRSIYMRELILLICAVLVFTSAVFAQKQKGEADRVNIKPAGAAKSDSRKKTGKQNLLFAGSSIDAELTSTLDVRKAKVGDSVVLKTKKAVKQDGEVILNKGAKLIGRVTDVQQRGKNAAESKIGMVFDRIEGKGLSAPITASIVSITDTRAAASVADTAMADVSGSSRSSGRASSGSSGGLLGGGRLVGGVGNTVGGVVNTTTQTAGNVVGTAGNTVGSATGTVGRSLNGVRLTQSASGSATSSTTVSSANKNLRLEKGVTFNVLLTGGTNN